MASTLNLTPDEHSAIAWPLQSFGLGDFIPSGTCELHLDRANSEFGLLYRLEASAAIVAQFAENDEPVYFHASWALAACHRPNGHCRKVTVLLPNYQVDMEFDHPGHAQTFVATLKALATNAFTIYEVPANVAFQKKDFNMAKLGFRMSGVLGWGIINDPTTASVTQLWKTGEWSDFVVIAGGKEFAVHKSILCPRAQYFANACKPGFAESVGGSIELEEDAATAETLLAEIYGVENSVTGSLFTTFALKRDIHKELIMNTLLRLFIACDKYNVDAIKHRAAEAFVDRLQLIHDPLVILDLASCIYDCCPMNDLGLRSTIIAYVMARFPAIHKDPNAKEELLQSPTVLDALHGRFSDIVAQGVLQINTKSSSLLLTPPPSPVKVRRGPGMTLRSSTS